MTGQTVLDQHFAGAIAALCIVLARGVWLGRRWTRIALTSVMAVLTPLFAWAVTRPPNWGLDLFYSQWALGATATAVLWLGSSSGDLRRSARAAASSPARPVTPVSLRRAVALMLAGAALYGLLMIAEAVAMLTAGLKSWFVVAVMVVMSPGAGTWMWMGAASNRGRAWARVVATVLFGAYTCCVVIGVLQPLRHQRQDEQGRGLAASSTASAAHAASSGTAAAFTALTPGRSS